MTTLTAIVVLHPEHRRLSGDDQITAANVDEFMPASGDMEAVTAWFRSAGFEVGVSTAMSFSITADDTQFEGQIGASANSSFDLDALPSDLRGRVAAIEFAPPPDFGPGNP